MYKKQKSGKTSSGYSKYEQPQDFQRKQKWKSPPAKEATFRSTSKRNNMEDERGRQQHKKSILQRLPSDDQHRPAHKQKSEDLRGRKRKQLSPSSSNHSSSISPPRSAKITTKRQRYQSPSPEKYHDKDFERGRSRERRGKKQQRETEMIRDEEEALLKLAKQLRYAHHSKKHADELLDGGRKSTAEDSWQENKGRKESIDVKRTRYSKEREYSDDNFSRERKHTRTDQGQKVSYGYADHQKVDKKHYKEKHKKGFSGEEQDEFLHHQKKHKKAAEEDVKPKKRQKFEVTRPRSPQFEPPHVSDKKVSKKSKDPAWNPSRNRSPSFSPQPQYKETRKPAKHAVVREEEYSSDALTNKKTKLKKKKAKKSSQESDGYEHLPQRKVKEEPYHQDELVHKTKKLKKRKRPSSQEMSAESSPGRSTRPLKNRSEWMHIDDAKKKDRQTFAADSHRAPSPPRKAPQQSPPRRAPQQSPPRRAPQSPPRRAPQSPPRRAPQSPPRRAPQSPPRRAPQSPPRRAPQSPPRRPPQSPPRRVQVSPPPRRESLIQRKRESPERRSSSRSESQHLDPSPRILKLLAEQVLQTKEKYKRDHFAVDKRRPSDKILVNKPLQEMDRRPIRDQPKRPVHPMEDSRRFRDANQPIISDKHPSRHSNEPPFYQDKAQPRYKEKLQRLPYDARGPVPPPPPHVSSSRYPEKQQPLPPARKVSIPAEPRSRSRLDERGAYLQAPRPASLERRNEPPILRREMKPEWKPPLLERLPPSKRSSSDFRDAERSRPPPGGHYRARREREPLPHPKQLPPAHQDFARRPQRVAAWVDNREGGKPRSDPRDRKVPDKQWQPPPPDQPRRHVIERVTEVRYKDDKRSLSRDRGAKFPEERQARRPTSPPPSTSSPFGGGTYREVRRSSDQHRNRDLGLEVTIRDNSSGGGRTGGSHDYKDQSKRPRSPPPPRMVSSYDTSRPAPRDRLAPVTSIMRSQGRSVSETRRPDNRVDGRTMARARPDSRQRVPEGGHPASRHQQNLSPRIRPKNRDYAPKQHPMKPKPAPSYRTDSPNLPNRGKLRPSAALGASNRDRSRGSSTSQSNSGRSPRRPRRSNPPSDRSRDRRTSRSRRTERDAEHSAERPKKEKESSQASKEVKEETAKEAADVLEVDWKGLVAAEGDQLDKAEEKAEPSSVLQRFTPGNVLLRMGISTNLLPDDVLSKVVRTCQEESNKGSTPLVVEQGLGALNRTESLRRSSWLSTLEMTSRAARLTSFADASFRQKLLGINEDLRFPTRPPQIINARSFTASMKHYLTKMNKIPVEVQ